MPPLVSSWRGSEPMRYRFASSTSARGEAVGQHRPQLRVDRVDGALDVLGRDAGPHHQRTGGQAGVQAAEHVVGHALPLADAVAQPAAERVLAERVVHHRARRSSRGRGATARRSRRRRRPATCRASARTTSARAPVMARRRCGGQRRGRTGRSSRPMRADTASTSASASRSPTTHHGGGRRARSARRWNACEVRRASAPRRRRRSRARAVPADGRPDRARRAARRRPPTPGSSAASRMAVSSSAAPGRDLGLGEASACARPRRPPAAPPRGRRRDRWR